MDIKALEKALEYTKGVPDSVALVVLKDAVQRFLSAQNKVYPQAPKKVSEPVNEMSPEQSRKFREMIQNIQKASKGCPACGAPDGVPHFCPGSRHNTGIEYWMNQPRAETNTNQRYVLLGSGDDLNSRGMGNGQRTDSQSLAMRTS